MIFHLQSHDFSRKDMISDPSEIMLFPRSEADYQAFLISQMRLNDELSAELAPWNDAGLSPFSPVLSISLPRNHHQQYTMNQLKLSLRAADDPRTIKEENGVPTFASVFSLHNATRKGREETVPITVKASNELAKTIVSELKKGVAFVVEGQLAYYKNPETNRETYSIWAEISPTSPLQNPPRSNPAELMSKSTTISISLDEDAYLVFQTASEIVSKAGIRVPTGQLSRP